MPALIIPTLISTAVGVGATLYASSKASKAQKQASTAQQVSTQAALDQEWKMYQQARADLGPGREAQAWALSQLIGGGGAGGVAGGGVDSQQLTQARSNLQSLEQQFTSQPAPFGINRNLDQMLAAEGSERFGGLVGQIRDARAEVAQLEQAQQQQQFGPGAEGGFGGLLGEGPGEFVPEDQPGFQFGYEEFIRDPYMKVQSAKGKRLSGETLKELTKYASDYASTQYDQFLNRYYQKLNPYLAVAGMGQVSAGGSANLATGTGTNIANLQLQQGNVQAQNFLRQGDIATQTAAGVGGTVQTALQEFLNLQANRRVPESGYGYGVI